MNKEKILKYADRIEALRPSINGEGFNMLNYNHSCGSPACIAGWVAHWEDDSTGEFAIKTAIEALSIDSPTALDLFIPWARFSKTGVSKYDAYRITPKIAAQTMRHLAETGEVVWRLE